VGCDISTSSTTSSTYPSTTTSYSSTTTSGTLGRAGSERKESWRAGARSQAWGAVWGRAGAGGEGAPGRAGEGGQEVGVEEV